MPGYQPNYSGLAFDSAKASALLHTIYPDVTQMPAIVFSFPVSLVLPAEASALQQMWQNALAHRRDQAGARVGKGQANRSRLPGKPPHPGAYRPISRFLIFPRI